jgi:Uma2 family endonuclease
MNLVLEHIELPIRIRMEKNMTDDELLEFCQANEPARVERDANGELVVMSPNFSDGGAVEGDVYVELHVWARSDGRGKTFGPNAGFTLPDSAVRAADAAWIALDRWNGLTEAQKHSFAPICPEFVIEVRSAKDRLPALQQRMLEWIANGAELAWLIDPKRKVVEVYRAGEETEIHHDPTSVQGSGPVRGFELVMERVWG